MRVLTFLCLTLSSVALAQTPAAEEAPGAADAPERSEQDVARRARIYARVGEVSISVGDIEDQIAQQAPFLRDRYRDPARLRELADGLVRMELLAREAKRREYDRNPVVEQATKQMLVQNLLRTEFDERITRESIPAADVLAYYEAHEDEFVRPAMVRASHILFDTRPEAEALLVEARAADASGFRALVRDHSKDTETKLRGGDLRYFTQDGRPPGGRPDDPPVAEAIVAAAFALTELGEVSDPIAVGENFSLVKLTGSREREVRTLEQAEDGIRLRIWRERRQEAIDEFVADLRQRAHVESFVERMRDIHLAPVEPAEGLPRHGMDEGVAPEETPSTDMASGAETPE